MTIYAGRLRHRLQVQARSEAADSFGEPLSTCLDSAQLWAAVIPLSGDELVEAQRVIAETTHRIETRWGAPVTARSRLIYRQTGRAERVFEVLAAVNVEERNRELHLMCREMASE